MKMPLFKFPSTIIWVDDSSVFLESIKSASHEFDLFKMKTFSKAPDLLRYLEKNTQNISDEKFLLACKKYEESDLVDHAPTDIDFDKICLSLEGNLQEDEISIVIIDYNMPEMNGIEFCKNVNHLPFKKILLTGAVAEKEVISAFNDKIIDCYIKKGGDDFIHEIKMYANLLNEKYFYEKSASLLSHLETDNKLHFSDPQFISFFAEWCNINDVIKYFIIDKLGNMRTINKEGEIRNFVVYNDHTLNEFVSLNSLIDEPNEFMHLIQSKQKITFFGERVNGWEIETHKWEKYLYPCNVVNGREKYYWCVVDSE